MKQRIREEVLRSVCAVMKSETAPADGFEIETPKQKEFGDFSTNAAMTLSKNAGMNPRELAKEMARFLESSEMFEKVEIAGPGFINFFVKPAAILSELPEIVRQNDKWGGCGAGEGKTVLVEFVSANPTGPLHFGHARNAAFGDALANLLEFAGWKVTREFYINDSGRQMEMLGKSVRAKLHELLGEKAEIPEDGYRGDYISDMAREIFESAGENENTVKDEDFCKNFAYKKLLSAIREDLKLIRVEFDNWASETELVRSAGEDGENRIDGAMEKLHGAGAVKTEEGAEWFKSTDYGDSQDWVLIKKDGSPTYFLADIAYHSEKISRGYDKLINVWGADHHSHVGRIKSAIRALGSDDSLLEVPLIQFVRLVRDGKEFSMGKRAGSYVTLREVADRVGADATRFFLLMRAAESHLDFDFELACKRSNENPVYYVQYAHARIESIKRNAAELRVSGNPDGLGLLVLESEIEIAKQLLAFPSVARDAAQTLAPHKIAFYLQNLASVFHSYYNANRVITDDKKLSSARLFLCECVKIVLKNGLGLLGVSAPERM